MDIQKERVLVVDDDEGVLVAITAELQAEYSVTAVSDAEQALAQLQNRTFAAIVSDVRLPGVDGLSLIRQCAVRYPDMVRLILTGFDTEEVRDTAIGPHGAFKVVKPWGDVLLITLKNAIKQRQTTMSLRRHLDLRSEALDIDRRLHPQLEQEELIIEAAVEMSRAPGVTAAAVYTFDEMSVSSLSVEVLQDDTGEVPELKKMHSSPVPHRDAYHYSVPIGSWSKPWAAVALRLTETGRDTLRFLDFVGRQAGRTLDVIEAGIRSSVTGPDDIGGGRVSVEWMVDELTTPATVLTSAPYYLKRIVQNFRVVESDVENMPEAIAELDELIVDLQNVAGSMASLLNQLRSQNTDVNQARPYEAGLSDPAGDPLLELSEK